MSFVSGGFYQASLIIWWHNSIKESRERTLWFRQSPLLDSVGTTNKYIVCWKMIKRIKNTSECLFGKGYISSSVQDLILRQKRISPVITWAAVLFNGCENEKGEVYHISWNMHQRCPGLHSLTFRFGKKIRCKTIRLGFLDATFQVSWNDFGTECSCELCLTVSSLSFWILVFLVEN